LSHKTEKLCKANKKAFSYLDSAFMKACGIISKIRGPMRIIEFWNVFLKEVLLTGSLDIYQT
jgi:hypothetical protein